MRSPGQVNWLAATLMSIGIARSSSRSAQTTVWGWGSQKTTGLFLVGVVFCVLWVLVELRSRSR